MAAEPVALVAFASPPTDLYVGQSRQLVAIVRNAANAELAGRAVAWSSSNVATATVAGSGMLTAVSVGVVTITATSEGKTASAQITIGPAPVASVKIIGLPEVVSPGDTILVQATVADPEGRMLSGRAVTWTTSDAAVATLSPNGQLAAKNVGSTTLTATVESVRGDLVIAVTPAPVASVVLSLADSAIKLGDAANILAVLTDARGRALSGRTIIWTAETPTAATITSAGVARLSRVGPLRITATVEGKSANVTVAGYQPGFVTHLGTRMLLDGKSFYFGGANSYYIQAHSPVAADDVLGKAKAMDLRVLRTWGFEEAPDLATGEGYWNKQYYQYWDAATGRPKYNDGPAGLQKLDYTIWRASQQGIRVTIPLVNNWSPHGGMDLYLGWYGLKNHDDFYTDARVRQAYKDWVFHLLTRVNSLTGREYRNEPAILGWELTNEARCQTSGGVAPLPTSPNCTAATITGWAREMSDYIKSIDPLHMIDLGSEGSINAKGNGTFDFWYDITSGVDFEAVLQLPSIDYESFHMYPGTKPDPTAWGTQFIKDHATIAKRVGKPVVLGEFGLTDKQLRDPAYTAWTSAAQTNGLAGWMVWMIAGLGQSGTVYPDFDGYTIYSGTSTATILSAAALRLKGIAP